MRKIQQTKKGILTVLAGTALLIAAVCYGNNWFHGRADAQSGYRQITAQEAREIMETKTDAVILDVRTQEESFKAMEGRGYNQQIVKAYRESRKSCATKSRRFLYTAGAETGVSRQRRNWRIWGTQRYWSLAGS